MTATTQTVQDQGVMVVECDVPQGLTLAEYRARRNAARPRRKKARRLRARRFSR